MIDIYIVLVPLVSVAVRPVLGLIYTNQLCLIQTASPHGARSQLNAAILKVVTTDLEFVHLDPTQKGAIRLHRVVRHMKLVAPAASLVLSAPASKPPENLRAWGRPPKWVTARGRPSISIHDSQLERAEGS